MKKTRVHQKIIFSAIVLLALFGSCDRQKLPDLLGPALCPSDNFVFTVPLQTSVSTVDFGAGQSVVISSGFSEVVTWTLNIKGSTSNALKSFTGRSNNISITWRGNAQEGHPFFTAETCLIELVLACRNGIQTSIAITPNTFNDVVNFGFVLQNMDGIGSITPPTGTNMDLANSGIKSAPVSVSPQVGNYYRMVGNAASPTWYFGGVHTSCNLPAALDSLAPSEVYLNAFINGNGTNNSLITFTFSQGGSKNFNVHPDWIGWKMVSFKLSDAGVTNVSQVNGLDYSLGAALLQGTAAEIDFDFIILTPHKPFYDL